MYSVPCPSCIHEDIGYSHCYCMPQIPWLIGQPLPLSAYNRCAFPAQPWLNGGEISAAGISRGIMTIQPGYWRGSEYWVGEVFGVLGEYWVGEVFGVLGEYWVGEVFGVLGEYWVGGVFGEFGEVLGGWGCDYICWYILVDVLFEHLTEKVIEETSVSFQKSQRLTIPNLKFQEPQSRLGLGGYTTSTRVISSVHMYYFVL